MIVINFLFNSLNEKDYESWGFIENIYFELSGLNLKEQDDINIELFYVKMKLILGFRTKIKSELQNCKSEEGLKKIIIKIIEFFDANKIKALYPQYRNGDYFRETIIDVYKLLYEEYKESSDWTNAIKNFKGENSIPIMTIHKSKGLEYSVVCFVGLEDDAFWNFKKQKSEDRCVFLLIFLVLKNI